MSRPNVAWRGAIEMGGFPINVALYSRVKKQRTESFRTLAPNGQPVKNKQVDSDGNPVDSDSTQKGVEVSKDQYVPLTEEALEKIKEGGKTKIAKPDSFCPLESIDLTLAIDRFAVRPDSKVPVSDAAVNIVWNGLRSTGSAYVSQVTLRGGSHDSVLVLYATETDFFGALLPFEEELYPVPEADFTRDEQQEQLVAQVIDQQYEKGEFEHGKYRSEYRARRQQAIEAVLSGAEVPEPEQTPTQQTPDLMAMLSQAVAKPKGKTKVEKEAVPA